MLKIQDLSKEVDMTAVRGGWRGCGDEDSEGRRHDRDDDRDHDRDGRDRDHKRCDADQPSFNSLAVGGSFNLGLNASSGQ